MENNSFRWEEIKSIPIRRWMRDDQLILITYASEGFWIVIHDGAGLSGTGETEVLTKEQIEIKYDIELTDSDK